MAHSFGTNIIPPFKYFGSKILRPFLISPLSPLCLSDMWDMLPLPLEKKHSQCVSSWVCLCMHVFVWSLCLDLKPSGLAGSFAYLVLTIINIHDQGLNWYEYSFCLQDVDGWSGCDSNQQNRNEVNLLCGGREHLMILVGPLASLASLASSICMWITTFALVMWQPYLIHVILGKCLQDREAVGNRNKLNLSWEKKIESTLSNEGEAAGQTIH